MSNSGCAATTASSCDGIRCSASTSSSRPARQGRTFLPPPEYCPLCPTAGSGRVRHRDSRRRPTRSSSSRTASPAFARTPRTCDDGPTLGAARARGRRLRSRRLLARPRRDARIAVRAAGAAPGRRLDATATRELAARPEVAYVFIFENRGKEIGVTLTHPHGQIYAFPFVPPRVEQEHAAMAAYASKALGCVMCDTVAAEIAGGERIVATDAGFVAYVPFAARLPYEVHVDCGRAPAIAARTHGRRARRAGAPVARCPVEVRRALGLPDAVHHVDAPARGRRRRSRRASTCTSSSCRRTGRRTS